MLPEKELAELNEEALALLDKESLVNLLATKTEHLLVASRCQLPNNIMQPLHTEWQMIQAEIKRRETGEV